MGIQVHREYGHSFPPLLMQRGHLSEILVNLLKNAREALGEKGSVFVTADRHRDYSIEISVRDNGPGIPSDKIERIFEAYYTTKERGTGLGLAIVKHNVELYGGNVRVESELGKGAKFTLIFPAKALMNRPNERTVATRARRGRREEHAPVLADGAEGRRLCCPRSRIREEALTLLAREEFFMIITDAASAA